jgi:hypothetical protein
MYYMILNKSDDSLWPYLFPNLSRKALSISPLDVTLYAWSFFAEIIMTISYCCINNMLFIVIM